MTWFAAVLVACEGGQTEPSQDPAFRILIEGSGAVRAETRGRTVEQGTEFEVVTDAPLTLTALPGEGWAFEAWTGHPLCKSATPVVTIPGQQDFTEATCTARFTQVADLVVEVRGNGTGVVTLEDVDDPSADIEPCATADGTCTYERGDAVSLRITARPDAGSTLAQLIVDGNACAGEGDVCLVDVTARHTVRATFGRSSGGGGDCGLEGSILESIPEVRVICDGAVDGVREPTLVSEPYTVPGTTGIAVAVAGSRVGSVDLTGRDADLGCEAPGVTCSYQGDPALTDGPLLAVAIGLSAPFAAAAGEYVQVAVAVRGTGPALPDLLPGTEGAAQQIVVSIYDGEAYVDAVIGTGSVPEIASPTSAPRAIVDGDQVVVLIPLDAGAEPDGVRVLSAHVIDADLTADVWVAPGLPAWGTPL